MDGFWQGISLGMIAVILALALGSHGKDVSLLLMLAACCLIGSLAVSYLRPVMEFADSLCSLINLDSELLQILLKSVGIGIVSEVASLICADTGNAALGKLIQLLGSAVILWLSLPLLQQMLELVENVLGGV